MEEYPRDVTLVNPFVKDLSYTVSVSRKCSFPTQKPVLIIL